MRLLRMLESLKSASRGSRTVRGTNPGRRPTQRVRQLHAEPLEERCLLSYSITDLGISAAYGINTSGQVVGSLGGPHAFLYSDGSMTDLGTLPDYPHYSRAQFINDSGQIAGISGRLIPPPHLHFIYHAFLYSGGAMTDLGTLGDPELSTVASGINSSGQIVGSSGGRAFLWSSGGMTDLNDLIPPGSGWTLSTATGINAAGQIVGDDQTGTYRAFLYSDGTVTDLGSLFSSYTTADAINNSGQVAGESFDNGDGRYIAFLYSDGVMNPLGSLGSGNQLTRALNDSGQVVGFTLDRQGGPSHAFLYSDGVMSDLNDLLPEGSGWVLNEAEGINNSGQVVGYGTIYGEGHGFVLTPDAGSAPQGATRAARAADFGIFALQAPAAVSPESGRFSSGEHFTTDGLAGLARTEQEDAGLSAKVATTNPIPTVPQGAQRTQSIDQAFALRDAKTQASEPHSRLTAAIDLLVTDQAL